MTDLEANLEAELKAKAVYYTTNILNLIDKNNIITNGFVKSGSSFYDDVVGIFNDADIHAKLGIKFKDISDYLYIYYFPSNENAEKYSKTKHSGSECGNRIRIEYPISDQVFN